MSASGRCLCGAVTLSFEGEPLTVRQCWCRDCQRLAAGGPTTNLFLRTEQLAHEGAVAWYESLADSGNVLRRGFCPDCGTMLFSQSRARMHLIGVRVGALDEPDRYPPALAIWTASAPAWAAIDPSLPGVEGQPPAAG